MSLPIFYRPEMSVAGLDSYSPSAGKPAAFMEMVLANFPATQVESFEPVTREDLCRVHERRYVDGVFSGAIVNGFGNKDPRVPEACLYTVGSMVAATEHAVRTQKITCSPTSGFHHAGYDYGGGYCTFNGLMVAAAIYLERHPQSRVGILDLDFHYGDGTESILKRMPALAAQIIHHTSGKYFHEEDEPLKFFAWLNGAIESINAFDCDVVMYQAGADMHRDDPLGGLLDDADMARRDRMVFSGLEAPVAWNLAGGYQTDERGRIAPVLLLHRLTLDLCLSQAE